MADSVNKETPRRIGVREFRENLSDFLKQARHGHSFLVASHDETLAEIRPPSLAARTLRKPGMLRDKIWLADDFDTLPSDVLAAIEGEEA